MDSDDQVPYGFTGKLAVTVYENFEVTLMFILGFILGGLTAPVLLYSAGFSIGIIFITTISILLGLTMIASEILTGNMKEYEL
ncbi:MAG: hypothetical protein ABEK59_06895 [Halobacteria archaeon]